MSDIFVAYGTGVLSTLIFVLIGCALEEREARKTEAINMKTALEIKHMDSRRELYIAERETEIWQKKKAI